LARDEAERGAESQIYEAIDEMLPDGEEEDELNWEALAKLSNTRWKTNFRDRDLKKVGRDGVHDLLYEKAREAIAKVDMSEGQKFLTEDFAVRTAVGWVHYKFGFNIDFEEAKKLEPEALKAKIRELAAKAYDEKETEYPVMAGLYHFTTRDAAGAKRYNREGLVGWARTRFGVDLELEELRSKDRDEIRSLLIEKSRGNQQRAETALAELRRKVAELPEEYEAGIRVADRKTSAAADEGAPVVPVSALGPFVEWLQTTVSEKVSLQKLTGLSRSELSNRASMIVEYHFRPEMRQMERALLLQILDTAWKDHLLAMDHLRSAVGLRSWAQIDPKVEYKREGMRTFELMWNSIGERTTDLIFRMEQLDQDFVGSTWKESAATHDEPRSATDIARQQEAAIDGSKVAEKIEPIRNRAPKVGRNDPCPCGSGKKYKNCHLRKDGSPV
jgi:preprotein translocase subunit SecA